MLGQVLDAFFGHAVKTPQVAAIGYGQSKVRNGAIMVVVNHAYGTNTKIPILIAYPKAN